MDRCSILMVVSQSFVSVNVDAREWSVLTDDDYIRQYFGATGCYVET